MPQNTGIALTLVESQGDRESVEPIELVVTTQDDDPIRYEFGIDVDCFRNGIGTIVRVLQQTAAL